MTSEQRRLAAGFGYEDREGRISSMLQNAEAMLSRIGFVESGRAEAPKRTARIGSSRLREAERVVSFKPGQYWKENTRQRLGGLPPADRPRVRVFISHRQVDKAIAHAMMAHLQNWGILWKDISSSPSRTKDKSLTGEAFSKLRGNLNSVNLFIIIHTWESHDWPYCMWEYIVSRERACQRPRVVVVKRDRSAPKLLPKRNSYRIDEVEIKDFVNRLHTDPDFIPFQEGEQRPVLSPQVDREARDVRALYLYEDLAAALEKTPPGGREPGLVYVAYSNEDKNAALTLYNALKDRGFNPWLDEMNLVPGQEWAKEIPRVIRRADVFLACLSRRSVERTGYFRKELRLALDARAAKPNRKSGLIPVRLDDCEVPEEEIPELGVGLRQHHWVDLWKEDGLERLASAVGFWMAEVLAND